MVVETKADPVDFILILPKRQCAQPLVFGADAGSQFLICPTEKAKTKATKTNKNKKTPEQKPFLRN